MLRALPLVTMRQEQRQTAQTAPLRFAGTDELVDDDLSAVGEVAELAFPESQAIGLGRRKSVLETHDRFFRQQRIDHGEVGLTGCEMLERDVRLAAVLVVPDRMTVEER